MADFTLDYTRFVPPLASQFATLINTNSQDPTLTDAQTTRGLVMNFGNNPAVGDNVRLALRSKTAGASQDIILRMQPSVFQTNFMGAGLALRESSTGKLITWGQQSNGINALRWTNNTPGMTITQIGTANMLPAPGLAFEWFKITLAADDPSSFYVSRNGTDWIRPFAVASQTAFMTFNQVGFYLYSTNGGVGVNGTDNKITNSILYFKDAGIIPAV